MSEIVFTLSSPVYKSEEVHNFLEKEQKLSDYLNLDPLFKFKGKKVLERKVVHSHYSFLS